MDNVAGESPVHNNYCLHEAAAVRRSKNIVREQTQCNSIKVTFRMCGIVLHRLLTTHNEILCLVTIRFMMPWQILEAYVSTSVVCRE